MCLIFRCALSAAIDFYLWSLREIKNTFMSRSNQRSLCEESLLNNAVKQGYSDTETVFSFEQCRNPPDGPIIPTMLQRVYSPWPCFHSINAATRLAFGPTDIGGVQTFFCLAGYSFRKRLTDNNFIQTSFTQPLLCGKLWGFLLREQRSLKCALSWTYFKRMGYNDLFLYLPLFRPLWLISALGT